VHAHADGVDDGFEGALAKHVAGLSVICAARDGAIHGIASTWRRAKRHEFLLELNVERPI